MKSWKQRVAAGSWIGASVGEWRQWALPGSLVMGVQASPVSPGSQVLSCRASTWEQEPSSQDTEAIHEDAKQRMWQAWREGKGQWGLT